LPLLGSPMWIIFRNWPSIGYIRQDSTPLCDNNTYKWYCLCWFILTQVVDLLTDVWVVDQPCSKACAHEYHYGVFFLEYIFGIQRLVYIFLSLFSIKWSTSADWACHASWLSDVSTNWVKFRLRFDYLSLIWQVVVWGIQTANCQISGACIHGNNCKFLREVKLNSMSICFLTVSGSWIWKSDRYCDFIVSLTDCRIPLCCLKYHIALPW